jgi:hypothetical protein
MGDTYAYILSDWEASKKEALPPSSINISLLKVGGILALIAGCLGAILGMLGLFSNVFGLSQGPDGGYLLVGALGLCAFVAGMAGGELAARKKEYTAPLIGIGFLLLFGAIAALLSPDLVTRLLSGLISILAFLSAFIVREAK